MKKIILLLVIFIQLLTISIILKDINKRNVLGVVSVNPIQKNTIVSSASGELKYFYELEPNSVIKPEPIFAGLENVSYKINNDGLNQIENYAISKDPNTFRIVAIGDSHTFGANVNTVDNYPSQLQQLLNEKLSCPTIKKFEVINLGVGGYDIQYTIERLKLRGTKYDPNLVIWLLAPDDLRRINELLIPKMSQYTKEARINGDYQKNVTNGVYYSEWNKARNEIIKELGGEANVLALQKRYINQLNNFYSGELLIIIPPTTPNIYKEIIEDFKNNRKNTFFYDQLPNIYQIEGASLPDLHPTKKGHSLVAKKILYYLIDKISLPCYLNSNL